MDSPAEPAAQIRGLNRAYVLMGVADGTLLPFIPLYLFERGLNPAWIGLVLAVAASASLAMGLAWAYLADRRFSPERMVVIASIAAALVALLLPMAGGADDVPGELLFARRIAGGDTELPGPAHKLPRGRRAPDRRGGGSPGCDRDSNHGLYPRAHEADQPRSALCDRLRHLSSDLYRLGFHFGCLPRRILEARRGRRVRPDLRGRCHDGQRPGALTPAGHRPGVDEVGALRPRTDCRLGWRRVDLRRAWAADHVPHRDRDRGRRRPDRADRRPGATPGRQSERGAGPLRRACHAAGMRRRNSDPSRGVVVTSIRPPWSSTIARAIARSRPAPTIALGLSS